jgi:hypothetical protein
MAVVALFLLLLLLWPKTDEACQSSLSSQGDPIDPKLRTTSIDDVWNVLNVMAMVADADDVETVDP